MHPEVQAFFDPATNTVSYVVHDPDTRAAAIIDPVLDFIPRTARISTQSADALLSAIADQGLDLRYVLETHVHADHLSGAHHIREKTGVPVVIGTHITQVQAIWRRCLRRTMSRPMARPLIFFSPKGIACRSAI